MAQPSPTLWFIGGTDELEAGRALKELLTRLCPPDRQAFGLDLIDGSAATVDEAVTAVGRTLEALRTVGFFDANKVVCLRDVTFFHGDREPGKYEGVKEAVRELAEEIKAGIPDGVTLILHALRVDKRSGVFKACKDRGEVQLFDIPEQGYKAEEYAREFVGRRFRELKVEVRPAAAALVVERAGMDTRQLDQEVTKLAVHADGAVIDEAMVRLLVPPCREREGWDLLDEYSRRALVPALRMLRQLLFLRHEPVSLMFPLQSRIRDLLVFRIALDRGWLRLSQRGRYTNAEWGGGPEADAFFGGIAQDPRKMHPYRCSLLAGYASRFTEPELQRHLRLAVDTHDRMLSGQAPAELLLERFLIEAMKGGGHARVA